MSTEYKTSASCVLTVTERGSQRKLPARLVSITNDGAQILCKEPLPIGLDIQLSLVGMKMREVTARVLSNAGDNGDGYRYALRLIHGSWPYDVFVSLTTMALGGAKKNGAAPSPPCLEELGLRLPCSVEQVERAFSERVRAAHPDRGGDVETFVRLRTAYLESLDLLGACR